VTVTIILQFGSAVFVIQGARDKLKHNFYTFYSCYFVLRLRNTMEGFIDIQLKILHEQNFELAMKKARQPDPLKINSVEPRGVLPWQAAISFWV
jgi:hypothetical protein